jgi:hypothetical protein
MIRNQKNLIIPEYKDQRKEKQEKKSGEEETINKVF